MKSLTYEKAGVPHLKGDPGYNRRIASLIGSTRIPGVLGSAVGFASLFDLKKMRIKDPLLVSATDGVGTKLEVANLQGRHDTIGQDLVAMCVNDIITCGARPLFFLDYFATGRFDEKAAHQVLKGIVAGCRKAGCALTGGETAIMPGFYPGATHGIPHYDIAGFCVGVVDRSKVITGKKIRKGNVLLGIQSSGFHSNGYSLLRQVFSPEQLKGPAGKKLLTPTLIYAKPVMDLISRIPVRGIINITGGGFYDNLPRVIPEGLGAVIDPASWPRAKLFQLVQDSGNIPASEVYRTFNMGIGMVLVLSRREAEAARKRLSRFRLRSWVIGEVIRQPSAKARVQILY